MSARKCKVCGLPMAEHNHAGGGWCMKCWLAYDRKVWPLGDCISYAAEWGAKRRAAAAKKAGGK